MPVTWRYLSCVSILSVAALPAQAQEQPPAEHQGLPLLQPFFDADLALPLEEIENPCGGYDCFSQAAFEGRRFAGVGVNISSVYVFARDDTGRFRFEAELPVPGTPDDAPPTGWDPGYGRAIALDGKELMVSHETTEGALIYLYERGTDGWSHRQTISLGSCDSGQWSIDIDDGSALLGTCIFERQGTGNYELVAQLAADDGQPLDDLIGSESRQTAIDGRTAVIGAPSADGGAGAAYVFRRHGSRWWQVAKLGPGADAGSSEFGRSVDLDGGLLAVGAPLTEGATLERPGVVHLYSSRGGSWQPTQVLPNPLPQEYTWRRFGDSVAVDRGRVLVGTLPVPFGTSADFVPGAYLYERSGRSYAATQVLAVSWVTSVFLSGNTAIAGTFAVRAQSWLGFDLPTSRCH